MKLSDLGAHQAEGLVLSSVRVHTESVVTGVRWWRKVTERDAGQRHMRLIRHCYISTDGQEMKRKCEATQSARLCQQCSKGSGVCLGCHPPAHSHRGMKMWLSGENLSIKCMALDLVPSTSKKGE